MSALASPGPDRRSLRIAIVAANTFEYDSRLLRTAGALAGDGHRVTVVGFGAPGLPETGLLPGGADLCRIPVDRRITSAFRPLPPRGRRVAARLLGFDPGATALPARPARGADRLRAPIRRMVEILAHQRRVGPWRDAVCAAVPHADVYHCKALIALPVVAAAAAQAGSAYTYDLADLHTEAARLARMPGVVRGLVRRREGGWVRRAAVLVAVSDGVAVEAAHRFRVPPPVVAMNCPPAWHAGDPGSGAESVAAPGVPPTSDRLRAALGLPAGRPILLYQGGFSVDRGIEELVAASDLAPLRELDAAVVFLGYGRLRGRLLQEAAGRPGRLFVLEAVPPSELLEWTASADLSFVGQPPRTLNQRLNLANKLFESIMAGVPVLVAGGTEHCRIVTLEGLGACCDVDAPDAIARAGAALLGAPAAERRLLRAHCREVALARYTWERQQAGLVDAFRELASRRAAPDLAPAVPSTIGSEAPGTAASDGDAR